MLFVFWPAYYAGSIRADALKRKQRWRISYMDGISIDLSLFN